MTICTGCAGDPDEAGALVRDLMINVTAFFRDAEAWDALDREVIAPMVERAAADGQSIRAWVPACSTGEEAYTIAMLLAERAEAAREAARRQDIRDRCRRTSISAPARKGIFPGSMVRKPVRRAARALLRQDRTTDYPGQARDPRDGGVRAAEPARPTRPIRGWTWSAAAICSSISSRRRRSGCCRWRISRCARAAFCSSAMPKRSGSATICSKQCRSAGGFTAGSARRGPAPSISPPGRHGEMRRDSEWHDAAKARRRRRAGSLADRFAPGLGADRRQFPDPALPRRDRRISVAAHGRADARPCWHSRAKRPDHGDPAALCKTPARPADRSASRPRSDEARRVVTAEPIGSEDAQEPDAGQLQPAEGGGGIRRRSQGTQAGLPRRGTGNWRRSFGPPATSFAARSSSSRRRTRS